MAPLADRSDQRGGWPTLAEPGITPITPLPYRKYVPGSPIRPGPSST